jgi:translation initiation factor IF-1
LAKEESIRFEGKVDEVLPNAMFKVTLQNQIKIIAYLGGKLRKHNINIQMGDGVIIEMSPYDLNRGRIVYRT